MSEDFCLGVQQPSKIRNVGGKPKSETPHWRNFKIAEIIRPARAGEKFARISAPTDGW